MANVLIVYGTTEGQTRKIANFLGDELTRCKCAVTVMDAADTPRASDLKDRTAVLIAASLHMHQYQSPVTHFVREHLRAIEARRNVFVSVSLSALGDDVEDQEDLADCVRHFTEQTGWAPGELIHVAGALRYTKYNYLKRWVMKRIAKERGLPTQTDDYEYTDWTALEVFATRFAASLREKA